MGPTPFFDWAACGTPKQYRKHLRHSIPPCAACRAAERRRCQDRGPEVYRNYKLRKKAA